MDAYGTPSYASSAPQSLAPSPQPVMINVQQNAHLRNLGAAAPRLQVFGKESQNCKCSFCGYNVQQINFFCDFMPNLGKVGDPQESGQCSMALLLRIVFRCVANCLSSLCGRSIQGYVSLLCCVWRADGNESLLSM